MTNSNFTIIKKLLKFHNNLVLNTWLDQLKGRRFLISLLINCRLNYITKFLISFISLNNSRFIQDEIIVLYLSYRLNKGVYERFHKTKLSGDREKNLVEIVYQTRMHFILYILGVFIYI